MSGDVFRGLGDIPWGELNHAYGSAEEVPGLLRALRSADAADRAKALSRFYSAVHHQGDVYPCTTASMPFLFALAEDPVAPGRDEIVGLLVSIGTVSVEREDDDYPPEVVDYAGAARAVRERPEAFAGFAADPDPRVRRAAIPGLALFLDDAVRTVSLLLERVVAEPGIGAPRSGSAPGW